MEAKLALGDLCAFGDDEMSVLSFEGYAKQWVEQYAGKKVPARLPGAGNLPVLEDAPGSYVKLRAM